MLEKLYKKLWSKIGGRPWTYITRDVDREWPLLFPMVFLGIGIFIVKVFKNNWKWIVLAIIVGSIIGHIFWVG